MNATELHLRLIQRDGAEAHICPWCELPFTSHHPATFEHIVARRDGGTREIGNIVRVHAYCNKRREVPKRLDRDELLGEWIARKSLPRGKRFKLVEIWDISYFGKSGQGELNG